MTELNSELNSSCTRIKLTVNGTRGELLGTGPAPGTLVPAEHSYTREDCVELRVKLELNSELTVPGLKSELNSS